MIEIANFTPVERLEEQFNGIRAAEGIDATQNIPPASVIEVGRTLDKYGVPFDSEGIARTARFADQTLKDVYLSLGISEENANEVVKDARAQHGDGVAELQTLTNLENPDPELVEYARFEASAIVVAEQGAMGVETILGNTELQTKLATIRAEIEKQLPLQLKREAEMKRIMEAFNTKSSQSILEHEGVSRSGRKRVDIHSSTGDLPRFTGDASRLRAELERKTGNRAALREYAAAD